MAKVMTDPTAKVLCDRVTTLRQRNNYTLEQFAAACGVSRSMLSQIERGQANPTLAVIYRIATAFEMSIGELVDDPASTSAIEVIRGSDPGNLFRADGECGIRTLSPLHMEKSVEFYELTIQAGAELKSAPHFEGTRELFTITEGAARVISGDAVRDLEAGDSAQYRADIAHCISNSGSAQLKGFLVVMYR